MNSKNFSPNAFIGDMGQIQEYVKWCYSFEDKGVCVENLVKNFSDLRFFVPIVVSNDVDEETGFVFDEFAGEKVILAFSNIDDFNSTFPNARPMAFTGKDLVGLALRMQIGRILLDKDMRDILIGRQAVYSIHDGLKWVPVWANESLVEKLGELLSAIVQAKGYQVRAGRKSEVEILIAFDCDKSKVEGFVLQVKEILSSFREFLQSVDSVEIIPFKA